MTNPSIAHNIDALARQFHPDGLVPWRDAAAPNVAEGKTSGRLRGCGYCGSMHPADVAAAIRAGARGNWADFKYGWPHKAYFDNVPNPHAGILETLSSSSSKSERYPFEIREPRFNERTGERVDDYVRYSETPKPAAATTHGKFYSVHLRDATPEDRAVIEAHLGLKFDFDDKGGVRWSKAPV